MVHIQLSVTEAEVLLELEEQPAKEHYKVQTIIDINRYSTLA